MADDEEGTQPVRRPGYGQQSDDPYGPYREEQGYQPGAYGSEHGYDQGYGQQGYDQGSGGQFLAPGYEPPPVARPPAEGGYQPPAAQDPGGQFRAGSRPPTIGGYAGPGPAGSGPAAPGASAGLPTPGSGMAGLGGSMAGGAGGQRRATGDPPPSASYLIDREGQSLGSPGVGYRTDGRPPMIGDQPEDFSPVIGDDGLLMPKAEASGFTAHASTPRRPARGLPSPLAGDQPPMVRAKDESATPRKRRLMDRLRRNR